MYHEPSLHAPENLNLPELWFVVVQDAAVLFLFFVRYPCPPFLTHTRTHLHPLCMVSRSFKQLTLAAQAQQEYPAGTSLPERYPTLSLMDVVHLPGSR